MIQQVLQKKVNPKLIELAVADDISLFGSKLETYRSGHQILMEELSTMKTV